MFRYSILPLHGSAGGTDAFLYTDWSPDPGVLLTGFAMVAAYLWLTGARANRTRPSRRPSGNQQTWFLLGVVSYLIALSPPLDDWADFYLVSAHMLQHMILLFVTAPLLLAGIPAGLLQPLTKNKYTNKIGYFLTRAPIALVVSNLIISFWHFPSVYDAALTSEAVHISQHLSLLLVAMLGWWPVLGTLPAWPKLTPPLQCLYLFLYSIPNGIVGAFITFAAPGLYHYYVTAPRIWGVSVEMDQQLAGVLMWVGGGTIYLLWLTVIFFRWAGSQEDAEHPDASKAVRQDADIAVRPISSAS